MLELENISFCAETDGVKKEILNGISLKIEDGFVAVTGPNSVGIIFKLFRRFFYSSISKTLT